MYLYLLESLPPPQKKRSSGDHGHAKNSDSHTEAVPASSAIHKPHLSAENMLHSFAQLTQEKEGVMNSFLSLLNILTKA